MAENPKPVLRFAPSPTGMLHIGGARTALFNFLSAFWDKEKNAPVLDEEIGNAIRLTKDGKVVNERLLAN